MNEKTHPLTGNKHAQQGPEPLDHRVILRVTRTEKRRWTATARPGPLADWMRKTLNAASKTPPPAD